MQHLHLRPQHVVLLLVDGLDAKHVRLGVENTPSHTTRVWSAVVPLTMHTMAVAGMKNEVRWSTGKGYRGTSSDIGGSGSLAIRDGSCAFSRAVWRAVFRISRSWSSAIEGTHGSSVRIFFRSMASLLPLKASV